LNAEAVRAFVRLVPGDADIAYPAVSGRPGHPVVWSPTARLRLPSLGAGQSPAELRADTALRVVGIAADNDAYVLDVDTPAAWAEAERRFVRQSRS
jgi:CTP:molybdopterin cytidylyltransferase MocA